MLENLLKNDTKVQNAWLTSFIDLTLLMTCFFVMMYSNQLINLKKREAVKLNISKPNVMDNNVTELINESAKSSKFDKAILNNIIKDQEYDFIVKKLADHIVVFIPISYFVNYGELMHDQKFLSVLSSILFNFSKYKIVLSLPFINDDSQYKTLVDNVFLLTSYLNTEQFHGNLLCNINTQIPQNSEKYLQLFITKE